MQIVDLFAPESPQFDAPFRCLADSDSPTNVRVGRMMLDLLDELRKLPAGPILYAHAHNDRELWLAYTAPDRRSSTTLKVAIDSKDYSSLENGLPRFHYRLAFDVMSRTDSQERRSVEDRVHSVQSAFEFVTTAIEQTRHQP